MMVLVLNHYFEDDSKFKVLSSFKGSVYITLSFRIKVLIMKGFDEGFVNKNVSYENSVIDFHNSKLTVLKSTWTV